MLAQPTSAAQLRGGSRRYACLDSSGGIEPRLLPTIPTPIRSPIPPPSNPDTKLIILRIVAKHARHRPRKHSVSLRTYVLHLHHLFGLQRPAIPPSYRIITCPDSYFCSTLAGESDSRMGNSRAGDDRGRDVLGHMKRLMESA
ncbi:integral membrane protein [Histoplasma capsulatum var. duboisii H88]|uniref:Integral membrane protein n=1 Tax=Ajellomyces capsulatus (strain H88) TaxID=544711 RepID=F0UAG1_AJEC8|nr:integral membrane protein [Histoplasma capsulatum var. duboisii H88]